MARDHGRIMASIWDDRDFVALSVGAQRLYLFLVSQPDLAHTGVLALRWTRWTRAQAGMTVAQLRADMTELATARFVVVDEDTEEVLIRTLIRNDGIYKQPNIMRRVERTSVEIASPRLRHALADELERLPLDELSDKPTKAGWRPAREVVAEVVKTLLETLRVTLPERDTETLPPEPIEEPFPEPMSKGSGAGAGVSTSTSTHLPENASLPRTTRGRRIPDDFTVTPAMRSWAAQHAPGVDPDRTTERFCDYWRAKAGRDACKTDWVATWRNWMRSEHDRTPSARPGAARPSTTDQRVQAGLDLAAQLREAEQAGTPAIGA